MKNAIDARISHLLTKLCSFRLVEAEAIAKKKQLERKARKLEKEAIEKGKQTCVKENKECLVIDCKDRRKIHPSRCQYCKKHSDPKT